MLFYHLKSATFHDSVDVWITGRHKYHVIMKIPSSKTCTFQLVINAGVSTIGTFQSVNCIVVQFECMFYLRKQLNITMTDPVHFIKSELIKNIGWTTSVSMK